MYVLQEGPEIVNEMKPSCQEIAPLNDDVTTFWEPTRERRRPRPAIAEADAGSSDDNEEEEPPSSGDSEECSAFGDEEARHRLSVFESTLSVV